MPATGCLKNTTITLIQPLEVYDPKWTKASLDRWIGRAITKFTSNTTHVVCTEKAYQQQTGDIRAAVAARKKGERFHIVSPEWLAETLSQQKRAKESEFSWEKLAKSSGGRGRKKKKKSSSDVEDEEEEAVVKRPKTAGGLLREVFQEHTELFVSEGERRALKGVFEREEEVKRQAVFAEERERKEMRAKAEKEAVFRKGAKKARNEIFSGTLTQFFQIIWGLRSLLLWPAEDPPTCATKVDFADPCVYEQTTTTSTWTSRASNTTSS